MKRIVVAGLALALANVAVAANWKQSGQGPNTNAFMDISSITWIGPQTVKVWMRYVHPSPMPVRGNYMLTYSSSTELEAYNCANMMVTTDMVVLYDANGQIVTRYIEPKPQFAPIIPDSFNDWTYKLLCLQRHHRPKAHHHHLKPI